MPSPISTSRRTWSTSAGTPGEHLGRVDRAAPGRLDLRVGRPGARRLEHRVADERDRLGGVEGEPRRPMASRELGGGEDEEPLLLPGGQAHRGHRSDAPSRRSTAAGTGRRAAPIAGARRATRRVGARAPRAVVQRPAPASCDRSPSPGRGRRATTPIADRDRAQQQPGRDVDDAGLEQRAHRERGDDPARAGDRVPAGHRRRPARRARCGR